MTNAGLKDLSDFKNLTTLDLRNTKVTDVGLKELGGLKHLSMLELRGTKVTGVGVNELAEALPKCEFKR